MITPDDVERLNADDNETLTHIEALIDAELKEKRGHVYQPMWTGWSKLPGDKKLDQRIWAEVARRYMKAGWVVEMGPPGERGPAALIIMHPLIAFPHESGL
ncbi:hypothetical protein WMF31_22085 [Sorangium sp. So ce1036]|uniref:hypothetical protein n=1 Tax=unclassified Sorangium TaxID=2621164 RepID=UPI003F0322BF